MEQSSCRNLVMTLMVWRPVCTGADSPHSLLATILTLATLQTLSTTPCGAAT